jgi:hypothetical protein
MEDHLKAQYKFKGLGSGKDLRTYLTVSDKTSDSVALTVRGGDELVDLEFYVAKEPRAIQLQRETFNTVVDERNADDVKALCYAIEESGMLKEQLATLQQHLKALLKNPQDIASNVEDIITVRSTIAETQHELAQIGRQMSVQDYKDRFTHGDPSTLYAKYASEPGGELKTLAAKLFKRVQWRDQLQNQSQKKGFWTGQVSNVRLRVVEQEIRMVKQSLTTMGRALDELIELREEGAGDVSKITLNDARYAAWLELRKRITELQRENFSMFPEAGATARDIRLKPWDRKNRKPVQRQKTSLSQRKIGSSLIGMMPAMSNEVLNIIADQDRLAEVDDVTWELHLCANLSVYGTGTGSDRKVDPVLCQFLSNPGANPYTTVQGRLDRKGLSYVDQGQRFEIIHNTRIAQSEEDAADMESLAFLDDFINAAQSKSATRFNVENGFTLFFWMKVQHLNLGVKDARIGSIRVRGDMKIADIVKVINAKYNMEIEANAEMYKDIRYENVLSANATIASQLNGTSVVYTDVSHRPILDNISVNVLDKTDLFEDTPSASQRRPNFPRVPRAFDPSSPADRGGERGGGVLFYGGDDDGEEPIAGHHKSWYGGRRKHKEEKKERERDDFEMDW